jgi:tetratricopeptide (TPR) repeat protein
VPKVLGDRLLVSPPDVNRPPDENRVLYCDVPLAKPSVLIWQTMINQPRARTADFPLLQRARDLWARGSFDTAVEQYQAAVEAEPDNVRAIVECARALGQRYEIGRAETLLQRAVDLAGADREVAPWIAQSYRLLHRPFQAIAAFESLRGSGALPLPLLGELAVLYEQTNQLQKAVEAISECVEGAPGQVEPRLVLARIQRIRGELQVAETLLDDLVRRADAPAMLRVRAWTEMSHLRDQFGQYDAAIAAIEQAKQILRRGSHTEELARRGAALNEAFRRLYSELDSATLNEWRNEPLPPDPRCSGISHLLGFPRSGTTLLEQIMEAHPQIAGSPERPVFSRDVFPAMYRIHGDEPLALASLRAVPVERLKEQRRRYLDGMEAILGQSLGGRVHLDKNPNHTSLIAGLYRLFPESRFLFALRDPRDVVVSAYLRFFPLSEFSVAFLSWPGTCSQYACDMEVWLMVRALMDGNWIEIRYEDVVHDAVAEGRRAVEFLGLPWHDTIAHYRDRSPHKVVNSPSQAEVRQPIHTRSIGRWRNYERYLKPYLKLLKPYCRAFGY